MSDSDELPAVVPGSSGPAGQSGASGASGPVGAPAGGGAVAPVPASMDVLAADAASPRTPSVTPLVGGAEANGGSATGAPSSHTGTRKAGKPAKKKAATRRGAPAGRRGKGGGQGGRPVKKRAATTATAAVATTGTAATVGTADAARATAGGTSTGATSTGAATTGAHPRAGRRRPPQPAWVTRLFAPPNIEGPRARFGIVWVLVAVPAVYFGPGWVAALYGMHAGIAALQTGQAWRREGYRASRLVAAPAAVAMPVLALFSYQAPGIVVLALPVLALIAALVVPRRRRKLSAPAVAGATLRSAVAPGVAAMGMVFVARLGPQTGLVFLLLVAAYDLGFFVFGAETRSGVPGIVMGAITSLACTGALVALSVFLFKIPPFDGSNEEWVFGALVAVFAPLGQLVASMSLPSASSWVPALRRLDSYILAAPVWAWVLWSAT